MMPGGLWTLLFAFNSTKRTLEHKLLLDSIVSIFYQIFRDTCEILVNTSLYTYIYYFMLIKYNFIFKY
jgi:hypothetical protein